MNGLGEIQTAKWIGPRMILNGGIFDDARLRLGSHLKFQTVRNETFQSVPEVSGTYRSSSDVKSTSSMTSEDFSEVYWHSCSGLQALFVTVFQTSVDFLCKTSYKSSSLLGYSFQSNHIVGCCNINFSDLSQIRREKFCFAGNVSAFFVEHWDRVPRAELDHWVPLTVLQQGFFCLPASGRGGGGGF